MYINVSLPAAIRCTYMDTTVIQSGGASLVQVMGNPPFHRFKSGFDPYESAEELGSYSMSRGTQDLSFISAASIFDD